MPNLGNILQTFKTGEAIRINGLVREVLLSIFSEFIYLA